MGKKSDTVKPATAVAESPGSPVKTTTPAPAKPAVAPAKAAAKKSPAKKTVKKKAATFSTEDIALRAYFIAEHRHRLGLHGDSHSDWIEAERQLKKEAKAKAAKKKPALKKKRA